MQLTSRTGASLAEFAVVISLMAILITAGQVRFSQSTERGKVKKSAEDINKIIMAANNFYLDKNIEEGIGRFPGQDKWNQTVPGPTNDDNDDDNMGYSSLEIAEEDLKSGRFDSYTKGSSYGDKWVSVFGKSNPKAKINSAHTTIIHEDDAGTNIAHTEWAEYIDVLKSPFQDGHYIYTVISGTPETRPAIIVADLFNPAEEYTVLRP